MLSTVDGRSKGAKNRIVSRSGHTCTFLPSMARGRESISHLTSRILPLDQPDRLMDRSIDRPRETETPRPHAQHHTSHLSPSPGRHVAGGVGSDSRPFDTVHVPSSHGAHRGRTWRLPPFHVHGSNQPSARGCRSLARFNQEPPGFGPPPQFSCAPWLSSVMRVSENVNSRGLSFQ